MYKPNIFVYFLRDKIFDNMRIILKDYRMYENYLS